MKKMLAFSTLILMIGLQSCSNNKTKQIYWVNSQKVDCSSGAGKMKCLSVIKGDDMSTGKWEMFYSNIEGFTFEEGYIQKIEVAEEQLPKDKVPADASSIKYTLVQVLEKQKDNALDLSGSWVANRMGGNVISKKSPLPFLNIDVNKKKISGSDGCNIFSGSIKSVTNSSIELAPIAMSRKMCRDMENSDRFNKAINQVAAYVITDDMLKFNDANGKEVLSFLKKVEAAPNSRLHDIWNVKRINGVVVKEVKNRPNLEINLSKMQVMGTNGCNNYSSPIDKVNDTTLVFGNVRSTRKMCPDMTVPESFDKAMALCATYKLEGLELTLYDIKGNEVLAFMKGD